MASSNHKIVISGSRVEHYQYALPVFYDVDRPQLDLKINTEKTEQQKQFIKMMSLYNTKKTIKQIIMSNSWQWFNEKGKSYNPVFYTMTYDRDVKDIKIGYQDFLLYIKRLNYQVFKDKSAELKYIAVPEYQPVSGRVHFHCVYFNLPFRPVKWLEKVWGMGLCNLKVLTSLDKVSNYLIKYISKDLSDVPGKRYLCSRGLLRPVVERDVRNVREILKQMPSREPIYTKTFKAKYLQEIRYTVYDFGQGQNALEKLNLVEIAKQKII